MITVLTVSPGRWCRSKPLKRFALDSDKPTPGLKPGENEKLSFYANKFKAIITCSAED
jgi:hypothetical protein